MRSTMVSFDPVYDLPKEKDWKIWEDLHHRRIMEHIWSAQKLASVI